MRSNGAPKQNIYRITARLTVHSLEGRRCGPRYSAKGVKWEFEHARKGGAVIKALQFLLFVGLAMIAPFDPAPATIFVTALITLFFISRWRPTRLLAASAVWSFGVSYLNYPLAPMIAAISAGGVALFLLIHLVHRLTSQSGRIYILRCPAHDEDIYKIGYTRRTAQERARELSNTSAPEDFFVVKEYRVLNAEGVEKRIHIALDKFRVNRSREYFRAPLGRIKREIRRII